MYISLMNLRSIQENCKASSWRHTWMCKITT